MPSLRSYFFRFLSRRLSGMMAKRSTVAEWRRLAGVGSQRPSLPRGVTLEKASVGTLPAEWLIPRGADDRRVLLAFHGGGWILGWDNPHRFMFSLLARSTGMRAFAPDYRLAPEYPFPAALDDCLVSYRFLLNLGYAPAEIVMVGDSAGGNLVLASLLALKAGGEPLPAGGVCLSPVTDLASRKESYTVNARKEAILPANFAAACGPAYVQGCDPRDPYISPFYGDLRGLPPLLIQAGGDELLLSDATSFAEKARQAGVEVNLEVYQGMWHVWQIYAPYLPEAAQALASVGRFIDHRMG